jgi:hypothetical protein
MFMSTTRYHSAVTNILLTLWVGGMWITGYLVTPTLFAVLDDRQLAGTLAGHMFTSMSYIGLVCGVLLLISHAYVAADTWYRSWSVWLIAIMLLIIVLGQFVLTPIMTELRTTGLQEGSEAAARFGMLHGVSSVMFLLNSIAGLVLVVSRGTEGVNRE